MSDKIKIGEIYAETREDGGISFTCGPHTITKMMEKGFEYYDTVRKYDGGVIDSDEQLKVIGDVIHVQKKIDAKTGVWKDSGGWLLDKFTKCMFGK